MGYEIDRSNPSPQFLEARNRTGLALQEQFQALAGKLEPPKDYRWIKAELTWPSFDDLTFGYRNQVFSVLVEPLLGSQSLLSSKAVERCRDAARDNHLVPCVFPIEIDFLRPVSAGWNLFHLETRQPIIPEDIASDDKIPMSKWEMRNFAIQIVIKHLKGDEIGARLLSFTDVLGIDPQILFETPAGARNWVVVRNFAQVHGTEWEKFLGLEKSNPPLRSGGKRDSALQTVHR